MNISSVVVHAYPQKAAAVSRKLDEMDGVEVHARSPEGKLVVTIEKPDDDSISETLLILQLMPDVLSASMVFHQFEE